MDMATYNPSYLENLEKWEIIDDVFKGELVVKSKGVKYLPATSGMIVDGFGSGGKGRRQYDSYKQRAVFHDFFKDAVLHIVGLLNSKPANISLPEKLQYLFADVNFESQGLLDFIRFVNAEQVTTGRVGVLLDLPLTHDSDHNLPVLRAYHAKTILDWDVDERGRLVYVKLDESRMRRIEGQWKPCKTYRELSLDETGYSIKVTRFSGGESRVEDITPVILDKRLMKIPFVFINSSDLSPEPMVPPLMGLANLVLTIYRTEADYRQNLFMQGQDTFVVIGGPPSEEGIRMGAGTILELSPGDDAKYVGVGSSGLSEQRECLQNDKAQAAKRAGELVSLRVGQRESGSALQTRIAAQTASLSRIANTGAKGLEILLRTAAEWVMTDPDEIVIQPNTDFIQEPFEARQLMDIMGAKNLGAPLSLESIHQLIVSKGLSSLSFEAEKHLVESEGPVNYNDADL